MGHLQHPIQYILSFWGFPLFDKNFPMNLQKRLELGLFHEFLLAKPLKTRFYLLTFQPI